MSKENSPSLAYLSRFVTPERYQRMEAVLSQRTRYVSVLVEDVFQSHNASAVLRSCDCFGIQDVHIIMQKNTFNLSPAIALGASKWLSRHEIVASSANEKREYLQALKASGYRLVATTPHEKGTQIADFNLSQGASLFMFGTELTGLSPEMIELADEHVAIPMYGFTESFNVSVSVGILLYAIISSLKKSSLAWQLSSEEKEQLLIEWLQRDSGVETPTEMKL